MLHLSLENIVHRDLAARNILITDSFDAKVSDFGLSRLAADSEGNKLYLHSQFGPLMWMAPESLFKSKFSTKSDVYSFGVVIVEVLTSERPYPGIRNAEFVEMKMNGTLPSITNYIPQYNPNALMELVQLSKECTQENPEVRPSFHDICETLKILTNKHPLHFPEEYIVNLPLQTITARQYDLFASQKS